MRFEEAGLNYSVTSRFDAVAGLDSNHYARYFKSMGAVVKVGIEYGVATAALYKPDIP